MFSHSCFKIPGFLDTNMAATCLCQETCHSKCPVLLEDVLTSHLKCWNIVSKWSRQVSQHHHPIPLTWKSAHIHLTWMYNMVHIYRNVHIIRMKCANWTNLRFAITYNANISPNLVRYFTSPRGKITIMHYKQVLKKVNNIIE